MKYSYIYSGLQAAFVSGIAVLPTGSPTLVDEEAHKKLSKISLLNILLISVNLKFRKSQMMSQKLRVKQVVVVVKAVNKTIQQVMRQKLQKKLLWPP